MKIDPVKARWTRKDIELLLQREIEREGFRVVPEVEFSWSTRSDDVVSVTIEPSPEVRQPVDDVGDADSSGVFEEFADNLLNPSMLPPGANVDAIEQAASNAHKKLPGETDERPK